MTGPDAILEAVLTLDLCCGRWRMRADPPSPVQLQAAHDAIAAVDRLLGDLYGLRATLAAQIRQAGGGEAGVTNSDDGRGDIGPEDTDGGGP